MIEQAFDEHFEVAEYPTPQEVCPKCGSDLIANEGPPEDGQLHVTCHDCSHQWVEPSGEFKMIRAKRTEQENREWAEKTGRAAVEAGWKIPTPDLLPLERMGRGQEHASCGHWNQWPPWK